MDTHSSGEHLDVCTKLAMGTHAGDEEQTAPMENSRIGGRGLLCAILMNRADMYKALFYCRKQIGAFSVTLMPKFS